MNETEEFGRQGEPLFRRKFAWADFVRLAGAGAVLPNCREGVSSATRLPVDIVLGSWQRVEKVGTELIATTNRARNAPKSVYLVPDSG